MEHLIKFAMPTKYKGAMAEPVRATRHFPDWYKDLLAEIPSEEGFPTGTAKRCIPMMDAFGAGYIIPLPVAVHVKAIINEPEHGVSFSWRTGPEFKAVEQHTQAQVGNLEVKGGVYKWINPWQIITPPGYSCLFVAPFNRPEQPFECFSAIVDTDSYTNTINFPFRWKKFPFDGVVEAGEPMMQVIPFKREDWRHEVEIEYLDAEKTSELDRENLRVRAVNHKYKKEDHHKKKW